MDFKKDLEKNQKLVENLHSIGKGFIWGTLISAMLFQTKCRFRLSALTSGLVGYLYSF